MLREALVTMTAEERGLLRVALTRDSERFDEGDERLLRLLVQFDARGCAGLGSEDRWALASALRRFRGLSWARSYVVAQVHLLGAEDLEVSRHGRS
ncbi:MAG: hypothetical protein KDC98_12935 [Planctomycetes bacterium]|nr:hypothetical protein [Planctomycetota bacterium]